ncbi:hypothetical protein D9M71_523100 [compost metagenome]
MLCGLCEDREGVYASVDFRMVGCRLRYAEQSVEFRHQFFEGATIAQHLNEHLRLILHQCPGNFFPAALGGECLEFTGFAELAHQLNGLRRYLETHCGIARGKAGDAQDSQGIFGECRRYVA